MILISEEYINQARETLASYPTGKIHRISRITQGYANINMLADTDKGRFLVRFCRKQSKENIEQEILLMKVLQACHFPTAYPLPDKKGLYIHDSALAPVVIYPFLSGKQPIPTDQQIKQVAATLARLHTLPSDKVPAKKNSIDPVGCFNLLRDQTPGRCLDTELKTLWLDSFSKTESCLSPDLPVGLIHGDLFPDNTLFNKEELIAFLDFEEFAIDTYLFDIGMAINGFCFTNNLPNKRKTALFLSSYEKIRPLTQNEKSCLDAYIIWTALGMACWHVNDCRSGEKPGQKERIRELIVRAHRGHPSST